MILRGLVRDIHFSLWVVQDYFEMFDEGEISLMSFSPCSTYSKILNNIQEPIHKIALNLT